MIKYNQLKMCPGYSTQDVVDKIAVKLHIPTEQIKDFTILKESIDARKKPDVFYTLSVAFSCEKERDVLKKQQKNKDISLYQPVALSFPVIDSTACQDSPIIIGAGPAGLFCTYYLAKMGLAPILLERGEPVDKRQKDVEEFWKTGKLKPESNVQFGEGGAGTFSDGKLNTLNKDPFGYQQEVLSLFVKAGANPAILYEQKPHLGTDQLIQIVKNLRNEIINMGGTVRFGAKLTDMQVGDDGQVTSVTINDEEIINTKHVVLAIGHSARDTFARLYDKKMAMEAKAFAVGYRVQHLQKDIDTSQYGIQKEGLFPPAPYKVTAQAQNGRGVYSFCMCPGGYVVNSSSEEEMLCINGMSYSDRGGDNANSAIIISVTPEDFESNHPLAGIAFQRSLEKKAYEAGGGAIPLQRYEDYINNCSSNDAGRIKPQLKGAYTYSNLRGILPSALEEAFMDGMTQFGRKIKGFDDKDTLLAGIEARTSSPVRILRDPVSCESVSVKGIYPCGEGAGYAGGITSAATDGLRVALALVKNLGGNEE